MKKAQITIMLIIVMVLLLIFGLMTYFQGKTTEQQGAQEIQEQRMSIEAIKPMQDYITQCLDIWALRGLELLGKQGGIIFKSQGGLVEESMLQEGKDYLFFGPENAKIAYANERLTEKENIPVLLDTLAFQPPEYPYLSFPMIQGIESDAVLSGITKLNLLNASSASAVTLKENVESFVTKQVIDCIDWSAFESSNLEIEEKKEDAQTEVLISDDNMRFVLSYPIKVTQKQSGAKISVSNFTVDYPFKLKKFFRFINQVIDQDNTNMSFSPRNIDTGMYTVSVIEKANTQFQKDDFLRFVDKTSLILDKPYVFYVARQNRPPALWNIKQSDLTDKKLCTRCSSGIQGTTLAVVNINHHNSFTEAELKLNNSECDTDDPSIDEKIYLIDLTVQDPDEDEVSFFVGGEGSISTPLQIPMRTSIFGSPTLYSSPVIGEKYYTVWIWANDTTPFYGPNSWREYQAINLTFVENLCTP